MTLGLAGCWLPRGDLDGNKQSRFRVESSLSGTVKAEKPVEQARAKVLKVGSWENRAAAPGDKKREQMGGGR